MKFTKIPDNHALVEQGLVYDIDLGGVRPQTDVKIIDDSDGSTAAVLRFSQTAFISLDIAPYVRRMFAPRPSGRYSGITVCTDRTADIVLEIDGVRSPVRRYTAFAVDGLPRLLTLFSRERTIACGEIDEIAFYAPEGGRFLIECGASRQTIEAAPDPNIRTLSLGIDSIADPGGEMEVTFESAGRTEHLHYDIVQRPAEAVRVAWAASSGAVESYTFPTLEKRVVKAEKQRYYGNGGYETPSVAAEASMTLVSDYEPQAVIDSLGEIISATHVWIARGAEYTEADVTSLQTVHRYDGTPNNVTVEIRTRKREEGLQ